MLCIQDGPSSSQNTIITKCVMHEDHGQHGGAVINTVVSKQEGPESAGVGSRPRDPAQEKQLQIMAGCM